jgi:hypothetical protein
MHLGHTRRKLCEAAVVKGDRGHTRQGHVLQCRTAGCYHVDLCCIHTGLHTDIVRRVAPFEEQLPQMWQDAPRREHGAKRCLGDRLVPVLCQAESCELGGCCQR